MPVTTRRKSSLQMQTSPVTAVNNAGVGSDFEDTIISPDQPTSPSSSPQTTIHATTGKIRITASEATRILNEQAADVSPPTKPEASRISKVQVVTLAANEENEDAYAYDFLPDALTKFGGTGVEEKHWSLFAVYDGHYGSSTSRYLKSTLIPAVYTALLNLYKSHLPSFPPESSIIDTIQSTFTTIDTNLISAPSPEGTQGSCALLTFHDTRHDRLFTACTGDSRAVLGKRIGSVTNTRWLAKPLSTDQNFASNPSEVSRVEAEHPNEKGVISQGRLVGDLAVSRAFGNRRFKVQDVHGGKSTRTGVKYGVLRSPPYVTAEPVVVPYEGVKEGDFVILATDGLWDFLSSEDAVALVGRWTDDHIVSNSSSSNDRKKRKTRLTPSQEEMYVFEDDANSGVHLIRNALGGVREQRLLFTLGLPPGKDKAKKHRDDITVMVVFFR